MTVKFQAMSPTRVRPSAALSSQNADVREPGLVHSRMSSASISTSASGYAALTSLPGKVRVESPRIGASTNTPASTPPPAAMIAASSSTPRLSLDWRLRAMVSRPAPRIA